MTTEPPGDEEKSEEERISDILGENPFYDDRVDVLLNCLAFELDELGLPEEKSRELYRELRGVIDKYELLLPEKGATN
jgi:hypothetical protein